jgi:PAS domain S-box-containing protein
MATAESLPLRHLLDSAPDGFIVVDTTGTIVWANQTSHQIFGYLDVELIGRPVEDLVPESFRAAHVEHRSGYYKNPRVRSMGLGLNLVGRKKDGSELPVEISLSPLHTGQELLVTAVVRDITQRRHLEDERAALALELQTEHERDRIAMDLHDGIMQDIYAATLSLELALAESPDEQFAAASTVERSISQLQDVIRSIRSFIFDLRPREFSGRLPEAISSLAHEFEQNSQIKTEAQVEEAIEADFPIALAVYHIAHEGLSNVRKHAQASHVKVSLFAFDERGCLEVRDNGAGFDTSVIPPEGHHGMRNMAARAGTIGAALTVESARGRGTTLSLQFPLSAA